MQTNGDNLEAMPVALVGEVSPNDEHVWTVSMKAPNTPGRYTAYFRMCTGTNIRFGHKVWCDILVVEPQPANPLEQKQAVAFYPVIEDKTVADKTGELEPKEVSVEVEA
jgi:next-to-BRCA1 protein 1